MTLRLPALAARGSASAERIYIYHFHEAWTKKNRLGIPTAQQPWGFPLDAFGTTSASGPTYTTAVLARAAMQRTSDPANATLFLVPPPTGGFEVVDSRWCTDPRDSFSRYWQHHSTNFFERRGGADHFFVVHKEGVLVRCPKWYGDEFRLVTKALGVFSCRWMGCPKTKRVFQRVLEVPYGGSVHNSSFWTARHPRPLLVAVAFNADGHLDIFAQMRLRKLLLRQCSTAGNRSCERVGLDGFYSLTSTASKRSKMTHTLGAYGRAVFSLQPAGDDGARKAIIDSVTMGCIPVLFHRAQFELWTLHLGDAMQDMALYLPIEAVLNGSLDVFNTLRKVPLERVEHMQRSIAANAHRLVYGFERSEDDAFGILLRAVHGAWPAGLNHSSRAS